MRSLLAWLSLSLAAACGGGAAAVPDAAPLFDAAVPDAGAAEVVFRARIPDNTPAGDTLYLAGNFNDWNPASPQHRLTRVSPLVHEITLAFPLGTRLEFKLTRGSWETVEKDAR